MMMMMMMINVYSALREAPLTRYIESICQSAVFPVDVEYWVARRSHFDKINDKYERNG